MDDFFAWLESPEGQLSEQALFSVMDSLENCLVDPDERVIVWPDGMRLSIDQTSKRIHLKSNLPLPKIESHVIGWLETHYEPKGLSEQEMEKFEMTLDEWIRDHQILHHGAPDSV
jgi:hypothetical protein